MSAAERMASMSREDLCAALQTGLVEMSDAAWEYGRKEIGEEQILDSWIHWAEENARKREARISDGGSDNE